MSRDEFEALHHETMRLPRSIEPERDLWPGIEARIRVLGESRATDKVVRGRFEFGAPMMLAAAAVAVVFVVALATNALRRDGSAPPVAVAPPATSPFDLIDASHASVSRDVLDALSRMEDLDPETVELIRRNLDIIGTAIAEIRAALADDPGNPGLNRLLSAEYQRRSVVLRRAAKLAESI